MLGPVSQLGYKVSGWLDLALKEIKTHMTFANILKEIDM